MTPPESTKRSAEANEAADPTSRSAIEAKLKAICEAVLTNKRIHPADNLFELGASSLKLIEIHEQIDQAYPGLVDLTELFDFPTVAQLAGHLRGKLAAPT